VVLGAAYEGPPGLVHGGVSALLLDHILGETASGRRRTAFTGTLTMRYRRGTPLGPLRLEGRIVGEERRKIFVAGSISDADGVTVEAEGIFIQPLGTPAVPEQPST
jgi:acyl-coenzyme A thioesterase PaaI-like protein